MKFSRTFLAIMAISFLVIVGCSGGGGIPTTPEGGSDELTGNGTQGHSSWGLWQFICDPDMQSVEVVKLRDADLHLNALKFLEPPANFYLTLESPPQMSGGILDVDIGLRHPFLGMHIYTGFDVCGILISNGSLTGFQSNSALALSGEGDTRLLNADGHTRWWNPAEFPAVETIFGYKDGILGTPDSEADFSATLNGYKYFVDGLEANDAITLIDPESRGVFSAGQKNVRHYKIDLGDNMIFNYAVDANWMQPVGEPPIQAPDDFSAGANRPEAWNVVMTEIDNSLAYEDGVGVGMLSIEINVFDWFNTDLNVVTVESLSGISPVTASTPIGGGVGYSTYELDLPGVELTEAGTIDLLITVASEMDHYGGLIPNEAISSYFIRQTEVNNVIQQSGLLWTFDDEKMLTNTDYMDRSPSLHQLTTYDVDLGFTRLEPIAGNPDNSRANAHMLSSTDNGQNFDYIWYGNATHFGQTLKSLKACQGPLGNTVFMYQSWLDWGETEYQHASTARTPSFIFDGYQENEGIYIPWGAHANEVVWAADDKVLCFGDQDMEIIYNKGTDPYSLYYNHSWVAWNGAPDIVVCQSPSQLGVTRCMLKDATGAIHFAYFGGPDGVWIKMRSNSDGLGENWDGDVYITEGLTDEYSSRVEPSLVLDPNGMFLASFVGIIDPMHSILYSSSTDGETWGGYSPVFSNNDGYIGEVTIDAFEVFNTQVIIMTFEMDGDIWLLSSLDGGSSFLDPVLVSDGSGNAVEPDVRADAQGFVHIAWSQFKQELGNVDDYDIHYRRAYLNQE